MNHRRDSRVVVVAAFVGLLGCARLSAQAVDPLQLQRLAVARIDAFIAYYRTTGDFRSQIAALAQADAELTASNRLLAARQDWAALAFGLIKQGHIHRMQSRWPEAVALYNLAEDAARRARHVVHQSDALAWRALAESAQNNVGQALADATESLRLAEGTSDKDLLARSLDVLGTVQLQQLDLAAAADTLSREVTAAREAKEPTAPYYAYHNRSDVFLKAAERCDFQRSFEPCYQALDKARTDLEQAVAIARRLGFGALVQQTEQSLRDVETRRGLIKSQEALHRSVQQAAAFHPTKAGDVLVTQKFLATPDAIPAPLLRVYEASQQLQKQLGGFADVTEACSRQPRRWCTH